MTTASTQDGGDPPPPPPVTNKPESVIASTTMAKTLTISDQHATILLTSPAAAATTTNSDDEAAEEEITTEGNKEEIKSILKLTLVPFHKTSLTFVPKDTIAIKTADSDEKEANNEDSTEEKKKRDAENLIVKEKEHSANVLNFLSQFDFKMTSESGAEYSFHEAFLKNDVNENKAEVVEDDEDAPDAKRFKATVTMDDKGNNNNEGAMDEGKVTPPPTITTKWSSFKAELISPASDRQVSRYMPSPGLSLITETPKQYNTITKPFIDNIVSSGSLSWLENVVQGRKEKERLLHDAPTWILNVDTKWRTHPDTFKTPRSEWFQHESIVDLYCLGIIKTKGVSTLRDLRAEHLPTLREMLEEGPKVIKSVYGVEKDQIRVFVHYQPQFYHFHVHFTRLENDVGSQVEKAHLLLDVIQNLEMDSEFYVKRTMTYKLSLKDKLYKILSAAAAAAADETASKEDDKNEEETKDEEIKETVDDETKGKGDEKETKEEETK